MSARFDEHFWSKPSVDTPRSLSHTELFGPHQPAESYRNSAELPDQEPQPQHAARGESLSLFVPDNYEPNYAYPLIVWLSGPDGQTLSSVMPHISTQNYLGLSLSYTQGGRVLDALGDGLRGEVGSTHLEDHLYDSVCRLRRCYHVHSERIYVAGFAGGATAALSLLLQRPEWLAGAIALHGPLPDRRRALARFRDLRGKRALLATGSRDTVATAGQIIGTGRLLHSAGLNVTTRVEDAGHELKPAALSQIDHWLMEGLCAIV